MNSPLLATLKITANKVYRYACFNRPPAIGAVPKGHIDWEQHVPDVPSARHGVISYDRRLTDQEVKQYELVPLGEKGHELVLPKIPPAVLTKAKDAMETLRYIETELKSGGMEREDVQEAIDEAMATLDIFKKYCATKHINYAAAIQELGGMPRVEAKVKIGATKVEAAPVDEPKFFKVLQKTLLKTGKVDKAEVFKRGRGLAVGVVLKGKTNIVAILKMLGWKQEQQGRFTNEGEWPLFVGQAGTNSYVIQLEGASESQSMEVVAENVAQSLPSFASKVYGNSALFSAVSSLVDVAPLLKEVDAFARVHKFTSHGLTFISKAENLGFVVALKPADKKVAVVLNFSFLTET